MSATSSKKKKKKKKKNLIAGLFETNIFDN